MIRSVLLPESFRGGCSFGAAGACQQSLPIRSWHKAKDVLNAAQNVPRFFLKIPLLTANHAQFQGKDRKNSAQASLSHV
jgi:hypothetical protein